MKDVMRQLLFELLKDSKKSDRQLAKVLGVSQATVSRMRTRLVMEGTIKEFTIIPDFEKLGYELMAITAGRFKTPSSPEQIARGKKWAARFPNVIFVSRTQGMGKNALTISLHKDYTDYNEFFQNMMSEWADAIENSESMLVSLKGVIVKPLSFRYLAEQRAT
ncbi:MAG: Lrp/AsnC family transcriptional regulator [Candidatus Bathyarchaeota archaeon]|nr:MAG: Lrp/AsnC family transcriptional regulator [Candidatus Bathyarchaeota archaeon]